MIHCPACQLWHAAPKCKHDSEAPCRLCGKRRGYRFTADDGNAHEPADECWRCVIGRWK